MKWCKNLGQIAIFSVLMNTAWAVQIKDTSKIIALPAGEQLKLNSEWIKYASDKVMKQVTSYPFLENTKLKGLMGTLNTEVKFYNIQKEGKLEQWFNKECKKLESFYPKEKSKISFDKSKLFCKVELLPSAQSKGMIQFLKAKSIKDNQVFVYTYNFYTPMRDKKHDEKEWEEMKSSITKLMDANL